MKSKRVRKDEEGESSSESSSDDTSAESSSEASRFSFTMYSVVDVACIVWCLRPVLSPLMCIV